MKNMDSILLPIIRNAGSIMLRAQNIESGDSVSEKGGDCANMVTVYDVAVQNYLMTEIKKVIPEAFFFAEEKENNAEDLMRDHCFVIDPIDGTTNFVHEYRYSCISVAVFSRGELIFAAIYDPYADEMFYAVKGGGAFLNGKPMRVADRDMAHSILAFGTCPHMKKELGEQSFGLAYAIYSESSDVRRPGAAALDMAHLAAGRNDMFFELLLSPWDCAAGTLLIKEAGGRVTNENGDEIDFSAPSPVFAATPRVWDRFFEIVRSNLTK